VTVSGADRHRLSQADDDLKITLETVRWLSHRDAALAMPLTSDYAALDRRLEELWNHEPVGMTDVAAGIGRAVIELSGDSLRGAASESRDDATRLILYLGDGKPRLPYDKHKAEMAALYAGDLASRYDIRIHVFELGYNAVSRKKSRWLARMARGTGGRHTGIARPGDVVAALATARLSVVERVEVRNRTTGAEATNVATAIDGSFYTEIPLVEGANRLRVEAVLDGGRRASEDFVVAFLPGEPTGALERQLKQLRLENAALIERTRADLAAEMEATRRAQRRHLDLSVESSSP
jgi:hypothetical protein